MKRQLARDYYLGSDIEEWEGERIFEANWLCLGHLSQWPPAPSYRTIEIEGHSLVVVRTAEGGLNAFENVCRHRGTQLCDTQVGQLPKSCITCPYHAWTYDLDGRLIGAPNMQDQADFERSDYTLVSTPAEVCEGLVWVSLAPSRPSVATVLEPFHQRIGAWNLSRLAVRQQISYRVRANWKILFQNYSECYHCPTVHPELSRLTPYRSATNDLTEGPILGGPMSLAEGFSTVSRTGQPIGPSFEGLDQEQRRHVYYYTVFPNLFVSLHPDYVMLHVIRRRSLVESDIDCLFLSPTEDVSEASQLWDEINRQDWRVCELTQRGIESPRFEPGPYSSLESMVAAFDDYYRRQVGQIPPA